MQRRAPLLQARRARAPRGTQRRRSLRARQDAGASGGASDSGAGSPGASIPAGSTTGSSANSSSSGSSGSSGPTTSSSSSGSDAAAAVGAAVSAATAGTQSAGAAPSPTALPAATASAPPASTSAAAGSGASNGSSGSDSALAQLLAPLPGALTQQPAIVDTAGARAALYNPGTAMPLVCVGALGILFLAHGLRARFGHGRTPGVARHTKLLTAVLLLVLLAGILDLPQSASGTGAAPTPAPGTLVALLIALATAALWPAWLAAMLVGRAHRPQNATTPSDAADAAATSEKTVHTPAGQPQTQAQAQANQSDTIALHRRTRSEFAQLFDRIEAEAEAAPGASSGRSASGDSSSAAARLLRRAARLCAREARALLAFACLLAAALQFAAHVVMPWSDGAPEQSAQDALRLAALRIAPPVALERCAAAILAATFVAFFVLFVLQARRAASGQSHGAPAQAPGRPAVDVSANMPASLQSAATHRARLAVVEGPVSAHVQSYIVGLNGDGGVGDVPIAAPPAALRRHKRQQSSIATFASGGFSFAKTPAPPSSSFSHGSNAGWGTHARKWSVASSFRRAISVRSQSHHPPSPSPTQARFDEKDVTPVYQLPAPLLAGGAANVAQAPGRPLGLLGIAPDVLTLFAITVALIISLLDFAFPFAAAVAAGRIALAVQLALASCADVCRARLTARLAEPPAPSSVDRLSVMANASEPPSRLSQGYSIRRLSGAVDPLPGNTTVYPGTWQQRNRYDTEQRPLVDGRWHQQHQHERPDTPALVSPPASSTGHFTMVVPDTRARRDLRSLPPPPVPSKSPMPPTNAKADDGDRPDSLFSSPILPTDAPLPADDDANGGRLSPYWQSVWVTGVEGGPAQPQSRWPLSGASSDTRQPHMSLSMDLDTRPVLVQAMHRPVGTLSVNPAVAAPARRSMPVLDGPQRPVSIRSIDNEDEHENVFSAFLQDHLPPRSRSPILLTPPTPATLLLDRPENTRDAADVPFDTSRTAASPGAHGLVQRKPSIRRDGSIRRGPSLKRDHVPPSLSLSPKTDDEHRSSARFSPGSADGAVIKNATVETLQRANTISIVTPATALSRRPSSSRRQVVAQQLGLRRSVSVNGPSPMAQARARTAVPSCTTSKSDTNFHELDEVAQSGDPSSGAPRHFSLRDSMRDSLSCHSPVVSIAPSSRVTSMASADYEVIGFKPTHASLIGKFPTPPASDAAHTPHLAQVDLPPTPFEPACSSSQALVDDDETPTVERKNPFAMLYQQTGDDVGDTDNDDAPVFAGVPTLVVRRPTQRTIEERRTLALSVESETSHISVTSFMAGLAQRSRSPSRSSTALRSSVIETDNPHSSSDPAMPAEVPVHLSARAARGRADAGHAERRPYGGSRSSTTTMSLGVRQHRTSTISSATSFAIARTSYSSLNAEPGTPN